MQDDPTRDELRDLLEREGLAIVEAPANWERGDG